METQNNNLKEFQTAFPTKDVKASPEINYVKLLRLELQAVCAWPQKNTKLGVIATTITILINAMCLPSIVTYLYRSTGNLDFFRLGHVYITCFMNIVALSRLLLSLTKSYKNLCIFFINDLHLFNHRNNSEYSMQIHLKVHKISHFFTRYLTGMMIGGIILFNTIPLYNNISSGAFDADTSQNLSYEHAVFYALPFDSETNFNGYLVVFFGNIYISFTCSSCFCIFDLLLSLMVFHLWGHLKILLHNLDTFPRPRGAKKGHIMYNAEELPVVTELLIKEIKYHKYIYDFAKRMSNTFGSMLFVYYGFHQVSGCLLLLECSQLDPQALIRYGPLTIILFQQLIQLSIVFELISSTTEKLRDAVYAVPWELMDTKNRKIFLFFLRNVQTPIHVKAMGIADVGVTTMASIIKTSISYFAFLRTMPG